MSGGNNGSEKVEWPELLGVPATPAVSKIRRDRPDVNVVVLPDQTPVPIGFNSKRVRVFYDSQQPGALVANIPIVGYPAGRTAGTHMRAFQSIDS
uniref:Subtilisin-chymotrypsin inhibitor WSCI n=1 Tax=Aegilops tauschii TaxID=37682 RepID=N1QWV4_AEGTA